MIPLIWLIAGAVLVVAEMVSGAFVLVMFGAAALVTAGTSALGVPPGVDVVVFALVSAALVLLARPPLRRRFDVDQPVSTGVTTLLGRTAEVVEPVDGRGGTVRIGGAVWSARPLHEGSVLDAGASVVVVEISGATAVVAGST